MFVTCPKCNGLANKALIPLKPTEAREVVVRCRCGYFSRHLEWPPS